MNYNYISILVVDDDFNKISLIIKTIKEVFTDTLSITQASNVQEAIERLQEKEYHLLVTDLQMPLKHDDQPNSKGGASLIRGIYKGKNKVNVPMYIIGLTQFPELQKSFKGVWQIWHYDSSEEEWKINLRELIFHISLIKSRVISRKIETIFVEGPTDKKIIEAGFALFFSGYIDKVYIDTIKYGGGASWVERQLFIWAKSLTKNLEKEKYLKAVGVFDNDEAGDNAIQNLNRSISNNSAEFNTFSIIKYSYKYSPLLKGIKSKGVIFPTTLEDLMSIECWKSADDKGWLESRSTKHLMLNDSIININKEEINHLTLKSLNFSENEILIITKKVKDDFKKSFCNLCCELNTNALESIKYLLQDVLIKLKLDSKL